MTLQPTYWPTPPSPRLLPLFEAARSAWETRADFRKKYPIAYSVEYWFFVVWEVFHNEAYDFDYHEQPDEGLRSRVSGGMSLHEYVESGVVNWRRACISLREGGYFIEQGGKVLDFGCGCGRLIQHMTPFIGSGEFHGVDVDQDAIAWCAENLDFAKFASIDTEPPLPYEDATFDAIYSYSVFSHLPLKRCKAWLEELTRVLKPGGVMVLTTMGLKAATDFRTGERKGETHSPEIMEAAWPRFEEEGFLFFPYVDNPGSAENHAFFEDWDMDQYGVTFILESHIKRHWLDSLELVNLLESPDKWQDFVILRRPTD